MLFIKAPAAVKSAYAFFISSHHFLQKVSTSASMAGQSIGLRRTVGTAAVAVLTAVAAFSCLPAAHTQPIRPWNPPHHVRDSKHSDADGRFMMVDLDAASSVPAEDRPEPIPGVVLWSLTCTGSAAYAQTLLDWSKASNLNLAPLCGKSDYFVDEPPSRNLIYRSGKPHLRRRGPPLSFSYATPPFIGVQADAPRSCGPFPIPKRQKVPQEAPRRPGVLHPHLPWEHQVGLGPPFTLRRPPRSQGAGRLGAALLPPLLTSPPQTNLSYVCCSRAAAASL